MTASTIDEVIAKLDKIIATTIREKSRLGYFPALYRKVTRAVQAGIQAGDFQDGPRIEKLDVIFANRYLDAYGAYLGGGEVSPSWLLAFQAAKTWRPIVLQHLLLGMNAHINLDLGIAAAETNPGENLSALEADFNQINTLLSSLVGGVKTELSEIWPPLRWLDRLAGTADDRIIDFSMEVARRQAWRFAQTLAPLAPAQRATEIAERDSWVTRFGQGILKPGFFVRLVFLRVRWGEKGSVPQIIDILK